MSEKIIEVHDLHKSYGNVKAVKGISFHVEKGKLFAFLGPNGAGKSTTIDMLCTLLKPDEGTVVIDGCTLSKEDDAIRKRIGVVFQDNALDALLTVRENLRFRGKFYLRGSKVHEAIERVSKIANLGDFIDRPYGKLSGGQKRRADIARALIHTPQVLFLDEPTTGLDPQTRKNVWDMITKLQRESGMTVFLTTHYMEEAAGADEIIIIKDGEIAVKGSPYQLRDSYSSDLIKLKPRQKTASYLKAYLEERDIQYTENEDTLICRVASTMTALDLLMPIRDYIESFEAVHGTMDDVFLNIIGSKQEE